MNAPIPIARDGALARFERHLGLASGVFAAVVLVATIAHALQLRHAMTTGTESRLQTVARILTKEVNRTLLQTRGLLDQVDDALLHAPSRGGAGLDTLLESLPRQQTLLREIVVVDMAGRITASSNRRHVGLDVSGYDFARVARDSRLHVGLPKAGRSFAADGDRAEGPQHSGNGFITVSRAVARDPDGLLVVAVFGADSLIGDLRFVSSDDIGELTLYRYDGQPLATSDPGLGRRTTPHPIFTRYLPDRETGGFADEIVAGSTWLGHFDTTADFPVVVEVRLPKDEVLARWRRELVSPALILLLTLVAVAVYTQTIARALRGRARSEAQAAMQERRVRNIVDTAADGIVTIDARGVVREYNRAAERIFGVPVVEALGGPLAALLPGETDASIVEFLRSGVGPLLGRGRAMRTRRRDGRVMDLHVAVSELVDQGERLFTGIVRDVTEIQQAEQRFRTLFQRSGEPHLLFDADGLVDCNGAAVSLLRAPSRAALLGRDLAQLGASAQADGPAGQVLADAVSIALRDGVKRLVWTARALDRTEVPVEMTLTPIRLGEQDAMLVTWHDIAERQRYEQQLRQARDAAESAASAKSQFLAMMSHELRTPMTGIIGMIDLLNDAGLSDEQAHFVGVLRGSAESLLTVLNDVLDYSKIEAGHLHVEHIDLQPAAIVREVVDLLSHAASQRGNTLSVRWRNEPVPALSGDPTRLRQVLFNLVGNAIKFTERGHITITGETDPLPDGRVALRLAVSDTGVGIAPDVLPTLFRPFQQADSSTTRRFGGTGLGLAICRHLVEVMDGAIGVDSLPGEGSTFHFVVRLARASGAVDGRAAAAPARLPEVRGLRLLVAEDNATNRLLIATRLRRASHDVTLVENGLQAVEAARGGGFDVVLMDMQMPELDGVGATRAIRALPGAPGRVPIVALTADAMPEFRERYMSSGLDEYLTKPIDWDGLDQVLRRYAPARAIADESATTAPSSTPHAESAASAPAAPPPGSTEPPSPAEPSAARPDEAAVAAMKDDLGEDTWAIVIEVFWPKADTDLADCRDAVERGDAAARRAAAHSLKGSASSLGFDSIASIAATLEHCDDARARALIGSLVDAVAAVRTAWCTDPAGAAIA